MCQVRQPRRCYLKKSSVETVRRGHETITLETSKFVLLNSTVSVPDDLWMNITILKDLISEEPGIKARLDTLIIEKQNDIDDMLFNLRNLRAGLNLLTGKITDSISKNPNSNLEQIQNDLLPDLMKIAKSHDQLATKFQKMNVYNQEIVDLMQSVDNGITLCNQILTAGNDQQKRFRSARTDYLVSTKQSHNLLKANYTTVKRTQLQRTHSHRD